MGLLSHIRRIDIELHSFCNRTCEWCPNKTYLRNKQVKMSDETYHKILNELNEFGFAPVRKIISKTTTESKLDFFRTYTKDQPIVSFLGYMESMSDIKLLKKRVLEAKHKLPPYVELFANTNGDYISKDNLDGLHLTTLNIMDYDCKGKDFWRKKLEDSGCLIIEDNNIQTTGVMAIHKHVNLIRVAVNWTQSSRLENRAGALTKDDEIIKFMSWENDAGKRIVPCPEPTYYLNITYDGNVMPCCHIRSDIPIHQEFILGNVENNTLAEIYYSDKAEQFRSSLTKENGEYPSTCINCQKIRKDVCSGAPNGFDYLGPRYQGNKINESVQFL